MRLRKEKFILLERLDVRDVPNDRDAFGDINAFDFL